MNTGRRRRNKMRKKSSNRRKIIMLVIIFLVFIMSFLIKNRNKFISKIFQKPNEKLENKKYVEIALKDNKKISDVLKNSGKDLEKRLNKLIADEQIKKENISVSFISLIDNYEFNLNEHKYYKMSKNNNFAIYMLYNDLLKEGKIDPLKEVTVEYEGGEGGEARQEKMSLSELLNRQLKKTRDEQYYALKKELELAGRGDWISQINKRYNLEIKDDFYMTTHKMSKLAGILASQKDGIYKYDIVLNRLFNEPSDSYVFKEIRENSFLAQITGSFRESYIDTGIILGSKAYVYSIVSVENDPDLNEKILYIINSWNNYYR